MSWLELIESDSQERDGATRKIEKNEEIYVTLLGIEKKHFNNNNV